MKVFSTYIVLASVSLGLLLSLKNEAHADICKELVVQYFQKCGVTQDKKNKEFCDGLIKKADENKCK